MSRNEEGVSALLLLFAIGWLYQCVDLCGRREKCRAVKSGKMRRTKGVNENLRLPVGSSAEREN